MLNKERIIFNMKKSWDDYKFSFPTIFCLTLGAVLTVVSWKFLNLSVVEPLGGKIKLEDAVSFLSYFAILYTFIAILWNTLETGKLKKLQAEQIKLNIRPFLFLEYKYSNNQRNLFIKNIGNNTALNVKIYSLKNPKVASDNKKTVIDFEPTSNIVGVGQEITAKFFGHPFRFEAFDIKDHKNKPSLIIVEYSDVNKNLYRSEFEIAENKFIFKDCVEL
jgi:hypothetical protein